MTEKEKVKVLMELRPSLEGFAGIPQETRLVFSSLNNLANVDVTGLIIHPVRRLWPGLRRGFFAGLLRPHRRVHKLSRVAISVKVDPIRTWYDRSLNFLTKKFHVQYYCFLASLGIGIKVYDFDAKNFSDFIWSTMFSKTLPIKDFEKISKARYATIEPSWELLNKVSIQKMRMLGPSQTLSKISTQDYDVLLAQTPFPGVVARNTQLVVRYHDAIPIFLPHTISNSQVHQHTHMANLVSNYRKGVFVCTSSATRGDLLEMFPSLEDRSVVIPDTVSHEYFQEAGNPSYLANIIRNHICPETEPKFLTSREKENFYHRNLTLKALRYIMMVSTLEPRKNHSKLIGAWDYLKNHGMSDLKLVLVGERGWEYTRILEAIAPWQQRGELFHLHRIPSAQLRVLYNSAAAVICPSVAEGFDLSGIEAMLCGGAVVASDIPVHREVYGNACEYFNPYSAFDQARAIEKVIHPDNADRRADLIEAGLKHSPRYRRENIEPYWHNFFEQVRAGAFKKNILGKFAFPGFTDIRPKRFWNSIWAGNNGHSPDRLDNAMNQHLLSRTRDELNGRRHSENPAKIELDTGDDHMRELSAK